MNQYSNPYTNPQIRGVDFGVIADAGQEAATGIAEANQSLIKQRAEAYEELKNSYADFTDKTTLERLQGLDEQQNNAIRQSAEVSIEDFSRMSQSKKQEILRKVGDIKAARNGLEKMMQIANDPNHVITKGLDDKQYQFLRDLGQAENLEFMPEKEGLGFILKDTRTGEEYSYSDINNMLPMYQNVGDTLKGAKLVYDEEAKKVYSARRDAASKGRDYENESGAYLQAGKTIFEGMNAKENKVLYENEVVPHDKWEGTEEQKQKVIEYNARQVEQRQQPVFKPQPKPASGSGRGGDDYTRDDYQSAQQFKEAFEIYRVSGGENAAPLKSFTQAHGLELRKVNKGDEGYVEGKDDQYRVIRVNDQYKMENFEAFAKLDEETGKTLKEQDMGIIDANDPDAFYDIYATVVANEKGNVYKQKKWVDLLRDPQTNPSDNFRNSLDQFRNLRGKEEQKKKNPAQRLGSFFNIGSSKPKVTGDNEFEQYKRK